MNTAIHAQTWSGVGAGGTGADYNDVNNWSTGVVGGDFTSVGSSATIRFEGGTTVSPSSFNFAMTASNVSLVIGSGTLLSGSTAAQVNLSSDVLYSGTKGNVTTLGGVNAGIAGVGSDLIINLGNASRNFQYGSSTVSATSASSPSILVVNAQLIGTGSTASAKTNYAQGSNASVVYTNNNNSYLGGYQNAGNAYFTSVANIGAASSLGKGSYLSLANGSMLQFVGTTNQTSNRLLQINGVTTGVVTLGNLSAAGNTTLEYTGSVAPNSAFSGGLNLYSSTGNKLMLSGVLTTSAGYGVNVNQSATQTVVSTTGAVGTATADGVVVLAGANVYGGKTTINNGTLSINTIANGSAATTSIATTNGSSDITVSSATGLVVGQTIYASGIPNGATITAINGNVVTISSTASATAASTPGYFGGAANSVGVSTGVAANLVINGNAFLATNATLQYTGAAASTDRLFTVGGSVAGATGTIDASGAGQLNFTNTGSVAYGNTNQARGVILTGSGSGNLAPVIGNNGSGIVSLTKNGTGTWSLAGNNTYTGATVVNAGTLAVNGRIAAGSAVTVGANGSANAILAGTGTVAGNITVGNGTGAGISELGVGGIDTLGTLNVGSVTFGTNSQYVFELDSGTTTPSVDLLQVTGTLTLNNTALVGSDLYAGSNLLTQGEVLVLAQYASLSGSFNGLVDGSILNIGNNNFQINYGTLAGYTNSITLEVVPEPATLVLLGFAGFLFLIKRRRNIFSE